MQICLGRSHMINEMQLEVKGVSKCHTSHALNSQSQVTMQFSHRKHSNLKIAISTQRELAGLPLNA